MRVLLMGAPGSGKGTQASLIAERLGVSRVSTGDLFRKHRQRGTELGRLVRSYMERGEYVPDDVTITMVLDWVRAPEQSQGFVLDGFPRTLAQAEALDGALEEKGDIALVLYIRVSEEVLRFRLAGRLLCRRCQAPYHIHSSPPREAEKCDGCGGELCQRDDDKPDVVIKRIQVYIRETEPVICYYRRKGKLMEIDGEGSIEGVGEALVLAVA